MTTPDERPPFISGRLLTIVAWVVATALLVLLARNADATRLLAALKAAEWRWLAAALLANLLILFVAAMQWWALLPVKSRISRRRMTRLFALTSLANNTAPAIVGHAAGALLLAAEPPIGSGVALSVVALDQVCVGIAKVAVFLAAASLAPLPEWMRDGAIVLATTVAILVLVVMSAALAHERLGRWGSAAGTSIPARKLFGTLVDWAHGLEVLRAPSRFTAGVGYALLVKVAEGAGIASVQLAFGVEVTWGSVSLVLAATALSSFVPISPGNIGTYEGASYAAYRALGVPVESALGIAIVQHACLLVPSIVPGYLLLLRGKRQGPITA